MRIIFYETGPQQRLPLFSYEGISYEDALKVIQSKFDFNKVELVSPEEIKRKRDQIRSWSGSGWYILVDVIIDENGMHYPHDKE